MCQHEKLARALALVSEEPVQLSRELSRRLRAYSSVVGLLPETVLDFLMDAEIDQLVSDSDGLGHDVPEMIALKLKDEWAQHTMLMEQII
jgi:hypothetical protein